MSACQNPPCEAVGPFRFCPVKGCGWTEEPPHTCWTCGAEMPEVVWGIAAREPDPHGDKRTCERCHDAIEFLPHALQVMNMVRHAAGLPTVECLQCDGPRCRRCGGSNGSPASEQP